eukprot:evm.model.scf_428.1 EVM.evm.TU.scf_428.1   scf_428:17482-20213(-)
MILGAAAIAATLGAGVYPAARPALAAGVLQPEIYGDADAQRQVMDTTTKAVRFVLRKGGRAEIPLLGGLFLRAAFHDAGTFNAKNSSLQTGPNGSLQYEAGEVQNNGLAVGIDVLTDLHANLKDMNCPVTMADLIQIAGAEAVATAGGPKMKVELGRKDVPKDKIDTMDNLPSPFQSADELKKLFTGNTYTVQDLVALSGAHTIGRVRFFFRRPPQLDETPKTFDNKYYIELLGNNPRFNGAFQSDKVLAEDPETRPYVEKYAKSKSAFFKDFEEAYLKMGKLGVNGKNTVAPTVVQGENFCRFDSKLITA